MGPAGRLCPARLPGSRPLGRRRRGTRAGAARPARPPWRSPGRGSASSSCSSTPGRGERPPGSAEAGPPPGPRGRPIPRRSPKPGRPRGSRRRGPAHPEGAARPGVGGGWERGVSGLCGPPGPRLRVRALGRHRAGGRPPARGADAGAPVLSSAPKQTPGPLSALLGRERASKSGLIHRKAGVQPAPHPPSPRPKTSFAEQWTFLWEHVKAHPRGTRGPASGG